jgi:flagellar motor protein MotB
VVRVLQNDYGIPPARMAAAGRSEYLPVTNNDTPKEKLQTAEQELLFYLTGSIL